MYWIIYIYMYMYMQSASSPGLPRLFVTALDIKAGRPGRFWYVRLRQVDTNVTFANKKNALVHLSDATSMPARL